MNGPVNVNARVNAHVNARVNARVKHRRRRLYSTHPPLQCWK